jgi:hypothetical protein
LAQRNERRPETHSQSLFDGAASPRTQTPSQTGQPLHQGGISAAAGANAQSSGYATKNAPSTGALAQAPWLGKNQRKRAAADRPSPTNFSLDCWRPFKRTGQRGTAPFSVALGIELGINYATHNAAFTLDETVSDALADALLDLCSLYG